VRGRPGLEHQGVDAAPLEAGGYGRKYYNDFKTGFFSGDAEAEVVLDVSAFSTEAGQEGPPIFVGHFEGIGDNRAKRCACCSPIVASWRRWCSPPPPSRRPHPAAGSRDTTAGRPDGAVVPSFTVCPCGTEPSSPPIARAYRAP
jgi:hypothetical protein